MIDDLWVAVESHSASHDPRQTVRIAGQVLSITSPDADLLSVHTKALQHGLTSDDVKGDLSISVLDGTMLDLWSMVEALFAAPADMIDNDPVYYHHTQGIALMVRPRHGSYTLLDQHLGRAVVWYRDRTSISQRDRTKPFRTLLYWWMREHVGQMLHAAAVGTSEGGVLITGHSGVGKSTASLACLGSRLRFAGDDHVLVSRSDPLTVYCLYNSAILAHHHQQKLFPHLTLDPDIESDEEHKAATYLPADQVIEAMPLKAVLLPAVHDGSSTRIEPVSPAAALAALAPASIMQLPGAGPDDFRWMASLIRRLPVYTLHFGSELSGVPDTISRLLNEEIQVVSV